MDQSQTWDCDKLNDADEKPTDTTKWRIQWNNALPMAILHVLFPYSAYLIFTEAKWQTNLFAYLMYLFSVVASTAGSHRLWSHRAYKTKLPLQIILLIFSTMASQGSAIHWARIHRQHHKFVDTNADPHNSRRGFFFSHIGWILLKKHPQVLANRHTIDISDLQTQPLLRFQHKYYISLANFFCFVVPAYIPYVLWGENIWTALLVAGVFRVVCSFHSIFLINSVAHMWGTKPYDKNICPTENLMVSVFATGEGYHNYHHTFPQDYKAAELGGYTFNLARLFIEVMAKVGWAYDLKTISEEMIEKRVIRTGDGTHPVWGVDKLTDLDIVSNKFQLRPKGM